MRKRRIVWVLGIAGGVVGAAAMLVSGCASPIPNRNPTGETFPTVVGQSLERVATELPSSLAGAPAVVIVGYRQNAQFDIDRWVIGMIQAGVNATIVEVPTIPGLTASFASGWIDDGMRSGIPQEDWGSVVTLYGGAARPVVELTGNERGQLARVIVLGKSGEIVWFDDEGFSPRKAVEVADLVARLSD